MIKVLALLTRKYGISHIEFVRHWFNIHGPLALAVPGIRRYVQSHITGTRSRPDIPELDVDVDGIAELWYDNMESFERAADTPEMKRLTDDGAVHRLDQDLRHRGAADYRSITMEIVCTYFGSGDH